MRFWRRQGPGPVPGSDPETDAVADDTENRKPEEEAAVADLQPAPSPEPDATEKEAPAEADANQAERGLWSGGLWRRTAPAAQPGQTEPTQAFEPGPVEAAPTATLSEDTEAQERGGWFSRLKAGMARSSARLTEGINTIFNRRRLDDAALFEFEELLIASDMGVGIAAEVTEELRRTRFNQEVSPEEVRGALAEEVIRLVEPVMKPLRLDLSRKPFVILVVGVNGSGKTTTIAKLAKQYRDAGHDVVLAAGDTFRAAGVEQLQIWGERTGCRVVAKPAGSDAAGLAFEAFEQARAEGSDILLIDTAGRLHNKANLMSELQKIVRVLKKVDPQAPHSVLLVLDATTGQNAHAQAEIFREMIGVTGIVMTKLDGTARGGVLVSLAEKYGIPIHAIGVGETADDLRPFEARAYARSLVGLDP
ncbi:MAG TPA: signal recognition particle-docking protein FtsY [Stellaceae bacterium]|jgi:fused signal recognition particle receptor